ncbi:MAG TPA: hypothetical protein VD965_08250 [Burkholderiales bacterium]|nr:hypothetical protein [Burkholderiales bacterium]
MTHPTTRVLIGDVAQEDARLRSILQGDELHFVRTTGEMERALDAQPFDLAVVCVQFDESRMFDTLRLLRAREGPHLPIACIRGDSAARHPFTMERYREPVTSLGADTLIDFAAIPPGSAGNDHIRRQLYGCIRRAERMRRSTVYTRALEAASERAGGRVQLAMALGVAPYELMQWMMGMEFPPYPAYMAALDVIAQTPPPGGKPADATATRDARA